MCGQMYHSQRVEHEKSHENPFLSRKIQQKTIITQMTLPNETCFAVQMKTIKQKRYQK